MIEQTKNNISVLIADDEVDFASTLQTRLNLRKFKTAMTNSGQETLKVIDTAPPDVLVLDLKMPDLDGLEVLASVKTSHPDVQVIILTGHGSFEAGREGMERGAFDYLMKPVDLNQLISRIEAASKTAQAG
ncbi:MAG: response regulator [Desulfobacterales bacterium]|nr:MAG: response regulator [Desulfobacterales bacterium]